MQRLLKSGWIVYEVPYRVFHRGSEDSEEMEKEGWDGQKSKNYYTSTCLSTSMM